jgi:hypothetical protein
MPELTKEKPPVPISKMDCCPQLSHSPVCDTLDFRYRMLFNPVVGDKRIQVPVEVIWHFRLERCSGELVRGDPVYSTTLLPGEQVRLFTTDRHSKWSYDSASRLSYRHETTSEESFFAAGMARAMSDLTINESGASASEYGETWAEGGGGLDISIFGVFEIGGGGGGGSYDSHSASAFAYSLARHAESASSYVAATVRAKSSVAVGEVQQRFHAQGESEEHYESSSRVFRNENRCHAVTYLFYRINKLQHIRFQLIGIERRVVDPAAPTGAYQRIPQAAPTLRVVPQVIPATSKDRLEVEQIDRSSGERRQQSARTAYAVRSTMMAAEQRTESVYSVDLRTKALEQVENDLTKVGLLDGQSNQPSARIRKELSWERDEILPTPGILVKGCLDECSTCEDARKEEIKLELEHKKLQNELLKRQIELLDKSREYRECICQDDDDEPLISG